MKSSKLNEYTAKVEQHYDADVIVYFGPIKRNWDDYLIDECKKRERRKNCLLMLTTNGGDAHAAYRIARCFKQNYPGGKFIIYVPSACYSAGTLITLAADQLILSEHAELGPLDVQMRKPDEVGERTSGLTPIQALGFLENEASKFFGFQFMRLRFSGSFSLSTRMAADIAAELTSGLLSHLYDQIDPLRLAEYDRTNRIAQHYGNRIKSGNVKADSLQRLIEDYPSHEFCIDLAEARDLFNEVCQPIRDLEHLGNALKALAENCLNSADPIVSFLGEASDKQEQEKHEAKPTDGGNAGGKPGDGGCGPEGGADAPTDPGKPAAEAPGQP